MYLYKEHEKNKSAFYGLFLATLERRPSEGFFRGDAVF